MSDFLNPAEILGKIKLRNDMVAVDFGCGSGGWVLPLAKILEKSPSDSKQGRIYAIDVLEEPLSALKSSVEFQKISNITIVRSNVEDKNGAKIQDGVADLVLMTNLLFQVDSIKDVLEEGKRVLKKKGRILVVDWLPKSPLGPKKGVSAERIKKIAEDAGLKPQKQFIAGSCHWGMVLVK